MLKILILIGLARRLGAKVAEKGHKKLPYQLLLWFLWFGGEIVGAFLGAVVEVGLTGREPTILTYLFALGGAIVGAVVAFAIANSLAPVHRDDDFYRDEGFDRKLRTAGEHWREPSPRPPGGDDYTD